MVYITRDSGGNAVSLWSSLHKAVRGRLRAGKPCSMTAAGIKQMLNRGKGWVHPECAVTDADLKQWLTRIRLSSTGSRNPFVLCDVSNKGMQTVNTLSEFLRDVRHKGCGLSTLFVSWSSLRDLPHVRRGHLLAMRVLPA